MNKKILLIIGIIVVLLAVIVGATVAVLTAYTPFEDENIRLDVPRGNEFQIVASNASLDYISTNPKVSISIASIDTNSSSANESYYQAKNNTLNKLKSKRMNNSEHNYNGAIYKLENSTTNKTSYSIVLFNDSSYSIIILVSDDINNVIRMADTFQLLKPYIIQLPTKENQTNQTKQNNTDELALGFLYGYFYGYSDGYSSSNSYDDSYYDDSYYDDTYYDDSYYEDDYYEDDDWEDEDYY
jgi:hypothetical protein